MPPTLSPAKPTSNDALDARAARRRSSSTPTCATSSSGTSTPPPAAPSGSSKQKEWGLDVAQGSPQLRRPEQAPPLRRRLAPRRPRPPLAAQGPGGQADLRLRNRRLAPASPRSRLQVDDFRIDYENFSKTLSDKTFPKGADWLMLGPQRPPPPAPGDRAPRPAPRRHRVQRRPRPALGHQAPQARRDPGGQPLQAALHRPGPDHPPQPPEHQVHVHHAEAARSPGRQDRPRPLRHHRHLLRRHRADPAVPPLRPRGTRPRHRLRPHLRQHADGPGHPQALRPGRQLRDHLPRPAAAGGGRDRQPEQRRGKGRRTARSAG